MPKVSIIVPVYNAEKYLHRCIDSILRQTLTDIEVILVDDGSFDSSGKICEEYARKDSRLQVIHQKNAGVAVARNTGLDIASGEYIAFVDSDDYIEPNMYQSMMQVANQYDCDVVLCDCVKEHGNQTEVYTHDIRAGYYTEKQLEEEYYSHLLMMENVEYPATISNCLLLWKSTLNIPEMRYKPGIRYSEDLLFGAQLMLQAKSFYYMKGETYYHYVMNPLSASHTFVIDKWDDYKELYKCIKEKFFKCTTYDFSEQIDKVLLFFIYNVVGDILHSVSLSYKQKIELSNRILHEDIVKNMFKQLNIRKLCISRKQKLLTFCYAHPITIVPISCYFAKKGDG